MTGMGCFQLPHSIGTGLVNGMRIRMEEEDRLQRQQADSMRCDSWFGAMAGLREALRIFPNQQTWSMTIYKDGLNSS